MRKAFLFVSLCLVTVTGMAQNQSRGSVRFAPREKTPANAEYVDDSYTKWRFSVDVAYSYRMGKAAPTSNSMEAEFIEGMRSGVTYGVDAHYFLAKNWGLGLRVNGQSYSHSDFGLSDDVNNLYIAPTVIWRKFTKSGKGAWVLGASIGYLSWHESVSALGYGNSSISRPALGESLDAGYDIRLGRGNTFLGFRLTLFSCIAFVDERTGEDLSSVNIGIGLRF